MSASFDNRKLDSAVEMAEHAKRPGASPTSLEAINTGAHTTIYEKAAMQSSITSQEASQLSMPSAPVNTGHSEPTQINSVHSLSPQGIALPQGVMAVFGYVKPLMPENGHAVNQSAYQTVSHSGNNSFAPSQSHFQQSSNNTSFHGIGSVWQGTNPFYKLAQHIMRVIGDLLA